MSLKGFKICSDTAGELIFWFATLFGLLLYFFSAPSGQCKWTMQVFFL